MTPGEAVHRFCVQCVGSVYEVENCGGDKCLNGGCYPSGECWFYKFRMGKGRPSVKLLRRYCLFCTGGDLEYVRNCPHGVEHQGQPACVLYPFRFGKNPNVVLSDEQKAERLQRFQGKEEIAGENPSQNQRTTVGWCDFTAPAG